MGYVYFNSYLSTFSAFIFADFFSDIFVKVESDFYINKLLEIQVAHDI
jgi:hypothetical protein